MKSIINTALWIIGVMFLLLSVIMIITSLWGALCFAFIGLICLPPIRKRFLFGFKWQMQAIIAFLLFIIASVTSNNDAEKSKDKRQTASLVESYEEDEIEIVKQPVTEVERAQAELSRKELEEREKVLDEKREEARKVAKDKRELLKKRQRISQLENKTRTTKRAGELVKLYKELAIVDPKNTSYEAKVQKYTSELGDLVKVIGVSDGDSITVLTKDKKQLSVRLYAIDAPELGQEYGRKSKDRLGALLKVAKQVYLEEQGKDSYGRVLAYVYLPDLMLVNRWSLKEGCSWQYREVNLDADLTGDEYYARKNKLGLWAGYSPMSPTKYRERQKIAQQLQAEKKRQELAQRNAARKKTTTRISPPKKEPASGGYWLNTKSNKRHNQGCRWYGSTSSGRPCGANEGSACGICGG